MTVFIAMVNTAVSTRTEHGIPGGLYRRTHAGKRREHKRELTSNMRGIVKSVKSQIIHIDKANEIGGFAVASASSNARNGDARGLTSGYCRRANSYFARESRLRRKWSNLILINVPLYGGSS